MNILVIDGQGGGMGKQIISAIRKTFPQIEITAVGTNSMATAAMVKAGAHHGATGENPVVVCSKTADVIIGPIGIVIADSMYGEVTEKMALAVGRSQAVRLLIPINHCNNKVVGNQISSMQEMISYLLEEIKKLV